MTIANDIDMRTARKAVIAELQIFDLKQMADLEHVYKHRAKAALENYRSWKKLYAGQSDMMARLYGTLEGQVLRRQAEDSCRLYWILRQDFRRALKTYLEQNGCTRTASF